jgi:hypothetical protein
MVFSTQSGIGPGSGGRLGHKNIFIFTGLRGKGRNGKESDNSE